LKFKIESGKFSGNLSKRPNFQGLEFYLARTPRQVNSNFPGKFLDRIGRPPGKEFGGKGIPRKFGKHRHGSHWSLNQARTIWDGQSRFHKGKALSWKGPF